MEVHVEVNHRDRQLHITKAVPRKKSCETMTICCETMTIWARADLRELLHLSTTNNLLARRGMHDYVLHETCAYKAAAYNLYINVYAWLQSEASRAERKLSSFSTVWGEDTGATEVVLIRPTQGSLIRLWTKDALEKDLRRGSDMLRQVGFENVRSIFVIWWAPLQSPCPVVSALSFW